jgi:3-oxoacyl-[acyl-carrier protein] reductase
MSFMRADTEAYQGAIRAPLHPGRAWPDMARGDMARGDMARGDMARGDMARGDMARGDIDMIAQNGKTAVVAAGSVDIATALSQRLVAEGFAVVLAFSDEQGDAEACVRTIRAVGGRAAAIEADLRRPGAMRALLDAAEAIFGGTDVLVSDAEIDQLSRLAAASVDDVAIDLTGTSSGLREAARRLRSGGRIIGICGASVVERSMRDAHVAMQACVAMLTRALAAEIQASCLTLNAVTLCRAPVRFDTLDLPEDLGDAIAFLAGPDGAAVNGRVLPARP